MSDSEYTRELILIGLVLIEDLRKWCWIKSAFFPRQSTLILLLHHQTNNSNYSDWIYSVTIPRWISEKICNELYLVRILDNGYSDSNSYLANLAWPIGVYYFQDYLLHFWVLSLFQHCYVRAGCKLAPSHLSAHFMSRRPRSQPIRHRPE